MKNRTSFASLIYKTDLQHVEEAEFNSNDHGLVALDIDYRLVDAAGDIRGRMLQLPASKQRTTYTLWSRSVTA